MIRRPRGLLRSALLAAVVGARVHRDEALVDVVDDEHLRRRKRGSGEAERRVGPGPAQPSAPREAHTVGLAGRRRDRASWKPRRSHRMVQ